jgi:hypothetical protein
MPNFPYERLAIWHSGATRRFSGPWMADSAVPNPERGIRLAWASMSTQRFQYRLRLVNGMAGWRL